MATVSIVLKAIDEYSKTVTGLNQGFELAGKTLGILEDVANTAFAAVKAGAEAFVFMGKELADTASEFEQMRVKMDAVFGEGAVSERALLWAREFGAKTPLTLDQVADRLVKLKSAGFDPLDGSLGLMEKLGDTSFALELDFERLLNPLRKLNSGGKATFESINQLAEAGIPIYDIMNSKLGMTAEQVQNIAKQNILGRDIVYEIIDALGDKYSGAMVKASNTAQGALSTIADLFTEVKLSITEAGPWEFVVGKLREFRDVFSEVVQSQGFKALAAETGGALTSLFQLLSDKAKTTADVILAVFFQSSKDIVGEATRLSVEVSDIFFGISKSAATYLNSILDALKFSGAVGSFEVVFNGLVTAASVTAAMVVEIVGKTTAGIIGTVAAALDKMADSFEAVPSIAKTLGIDPAGFRAVTDRVSSLAATVSSDTSKLSKGILGIGNASTTAVSGISRAVENWRIGLDDVDGAHQRLNATIRAVGEAAKDSYGQITAADMAQVDAFNNPENDALTTLEGIMSDLEAFDQETAASLQGINQKKALESAGQGSSVMQDTARLLSGANWPAEFSALGEFLFKWVLSSATGSPVPMAITTGL